eukprot:5427374-Amphidinium_carterae.1
MKTSRVQAKTVGELPISLPAYPGGVAERVPDKTNEEKFIPPAYPGGSSVQAIRRNAKAQNATRRTLPAYPGRAVVPRNTRNHPVS